MCMECLTVGLVLGQCSNREPRSQAMTCRDFAEFLGEYLDGSLPEAQRAVFEEHLAECPDCVAYLQTYQQTIRLGKAACVHPDDAVPPEVPDELVQAILAARRHRGG